jgi:hypothetical protein
VQVRFELVAEERIADTPPPRAPRVLQTEWVEDAALDLPTKEAQLRAFVATAVSASVLSVIELGGQAVSIRCAVANRIDPRSCP